MIWEFCGGWRMFENQIWPDVTHDTVVVLSLSWLCITKSCGLHDLHFFYLRRHLMQTRKCFTSLRVTLKIIFLLTLQHTDYICPLAQNVIFAVDKMSPEAPLSSALSVCLRAHSYLNEGIAARGRWRWQNRVTVIQSLDRSLKSVYRIIAVWPFLLRVR